MTQTIRMIVPDMTCGHCKASIETTLNALSGVQNVAVDLATKKVQVEADDQVSFDQLVNTLDGIGFTGQAE